MDPEFKQSLYDIVAKTIKPKTYTVSYNIELLITDRKAGIKLVKEILQKVQANGVGVLYLGAPHYRITSTASSYPKAEERIKETEKILDTYQKQATYDIKQTK